MNPTVFLYRIAAGMALAVAAVLGACGGAGPGGIDGTGIRPNAVSFGTITAFGSIWVNGVEYDTRGATIRIDDRNVTENELRLGMLVRVDSLATDSVATTVAVDEAIKGRVEAKLDANRWVVMGQTVQIDDLTRFDNGVVPAVGDRVNVHGLVVAEGTVAAGFIEPGNATAPFAVKGLVKNHDTASRTFSMGSLVVQYAAAAVSDMPAGNWNGLLVEVKGSACAGTPVCGTLTATRVQPNGPQVSTATVAEFEGFVLSLTSNGFVLGSQTVVITPATRFENGAAADIAVGVKLEAEGSISGGVLTATKVSLRDNVRLEGDVAGVGGGTITLAGLPGIVIQANSLTELDGVGSVSALAVGNHLRLRGRATAGNGVIATELELRSTSPDTRIELRGPVDAVAAPMLTILGTMVDTTPVSDVDFKGRSDAPIGRNAFFAAVTVGLPVKARGRLEGTVPRWEEMELED